MTTYVTTKTADLIRQDGVDPITVSAGEALAISGRLFNRPSSDSEDAKFVAEFNTAWESLVADLKQQASLARFTAAMPRIGELCQMEARLNGIYSPKGQSDYAARVAFWEFAWDTDSYEVYRSFAQLCFEHMQSDI